MPQWLLLPLVALATVCLMMLILWLIGRKVDNYAVVDVGWSYSFAIVAVVYLVLSGNYGPRQIFTTALVSLWSIRLGTHLLKNRILGRPEEGRYVTLRQKWGPNFQRAFFIFFQAQALSVIILAIPVLLVVLSDKTALDGFVLAGLVVAIIAIVGESIADQQLHTFLSKPENKGQVCKKGLWRYSRHPNYFFESLIWVGFALFALPSNFGWLGLISPITIWYLILRVTGIPPTEAQSLKSKGDAYRQYQRETSAFFPMPPRTAS